MRRNGFKIMYGLLGLVKPLAHIMILCVTLGTLGHLCATAITVLAANLRLVSMEISPWTLTFFGCGLAMIICAVFRRSARRSEARLGTRRR